MMLGMHGDMKCLAQCGETLRVGNNLITKQYVCKLREPYDTIVKEIIKRDATSVINYISGNVARTISTEGGDLSASQIRT